MAWFGLYPQDYKKAITTTVWQGGKTDTIAAMKGALVGAHIGSDIAIGLPIVRLEEGDEFLSHIRRLAGMLSNS